MAQVLNNPVVIVGSGGGEDRWNDYLAVYGDNWSNLFASYPGTSVDLFLDGVDSSQIRQMANMFAYCYNLKSIPNFDMSGVQSINSMFYYCQNIEAVPDFDTSKCSNLNKLFSNCHKLKAVPYIRCNVATDVGDIFNTCRALKTIEIDSWEKVTSVYSANAMCVNCNSLKDFIIRNATKAPIINTGGFDAYNAMFKGCYHFTGEFHYEYNPRGLADGHIYIKDELVDTLKAAANWSTYADFIYPESSYTPSAFDPLTKFGPAVGESASDFSKVLFMVDGHYELKQRAVAIYFNIPADNSVSKLTIEYDSSIANYPYELFGSVIDFDQNYDPYLNSATAQYYVPRSEAGTSGSMVYDNLPVGDHWVVFRYSSANPSAGGPMIFNITFE